MTFIREPMAIETKSMEIIEDILGANSFTPAEKTVVKRVIHASGDPEYGELISFYPEAVNRGLQALQGGAPIFTDVRMVEVGINARAAGSLGSIIRCGITAPGVVELAQKEGITRAMAAFRLWGRELEGSVVGIGNAPTALFELLRLHQEEGITPALVVGVPVGFVGAAEAKEALSNSSLPHITVKGRKGGSPIAVSAINALLYLLKPSR